MPTVLRVNGFAMRIYPNDHEPAHVHILKAGGEVKVKLGLNGGVPLLLQVTEMNNNDVARALAIVQERNDELLEKWRAIHGA